MRAILSIRCLHSDRAPAVDAPWTCGPAPRGGPRPSRDAIGASAPPAVLGAAHARAAKHASGGAVSAMRERPDRSPEIARSPRANGRAPRGSWRGTLDEILPLQVRCIAARATL